ncbi:MAG: hypothetical protein CMD67_00145 [Gammaproteobacteria bacterium]|nr:hypothetical protein [Gammaproteobacteria bacterium]
MFEDFFTRAIFAGIGVALVSGPLGCFIVWRRLAYFGDTISHASLLGVALGILLDSNTTLIVFCVSGIIAIALLFMQTLTKVGIDSLLGIFAHAGLALGLLVLSFMTWIRVDIMGFLFGDILSVSISDLIIIYSGGSIVLAIIFIIWRPFFAATVNPEIAKGEGTNVRIIEFVFFLLIASVVAIAIKVVGVLLITSLLIIPAVTARRFSTSPEQMAIGASLIAVISVIGGLYGSLKLDTPSGPSIVVAAFCLFILSVLPIWKILHLSKIPNKDITG